MRWTRMRWTRMRWTRNRAIITASSAVAVTVVAVGAGLILSSPSARHQPAARPSPSASASPSVSGPLLSPFTGEPVRSLGPVLAVKIDNIVYARPQTGLTRADIVYVLPVGRRAQPVHGDLLLALPARDRPGPQRQARRPSNCYASSAVPAFRILGSSDADAPGSGAAHTVDLYAGRVQGYYRDYNRIAPDNLYALTSTLLSEAKGASKAHNIGFKFGPAPSGGRRTARMSVSYPAASFTFTWSASKKRWLVWMDGAWPAAQKARSYPPRRS